MKLSITLLGCLLHGVLVAGAVAEIALEVHQPELSEAYLVNLEDELADSIGKSGESMSKSAGLFDELSRMINDTMAPAILAAHDSAQIQLQTLGAAFQSCVAAQSSDTGSGNVVSSPAIAAKLQEHSACRLKQAGAGEEQDQCSNKLQQERTVQTAACNAVPGSDGTAPPLDSTRSVGCHVTPGDYEGWLASFSHQIGTLKKQYDDAQSGCGNATKLADATVPQCAAANASHAGNKSACDGLQAQAESLACSSEATAGAACSAYDGCYDAAKSAYLEQNETIAAAQLNRTVQWRMLKRIQCLLKEESAGASHEGIDACREATIDTSHLDLVYPELPPKASCEVAASEGELPCSSDWLQQYGSLPASAPAGPCIPCATTTTTTWSPWTLVLRQKYPGVFKKNQWSLNAGDPTNDNYAILDQLENFRACGKFEFKLAWPLDGLEDQVWRQTSNPVTMKARGVTGYEAISTPYTTGGWRGLENSLSTNALMDGSAGTWFWYSVGAFKNYQPNTFPGPYSMHVKGVELWVQSIKTEPPSAGDAAWPLVFRQTYPFTFSKNEWSLNAGDPTNDNYAILDQLENFRFNGKFEFKLVWPCSGHEDQVWRQTSNPVTRTKRGVTGYEAISAPHKGNRWGGLENNLGKSTLLDGSVASGNWWYAVGALKLHQGLYPGPGSDTVSAVELYVHIIQNDSPTNIQNQGLCREGRLSANGACCEWMCGSCGGKGCSSRPGGGAKCCSKAILSGKKKCVKETDVACKMPA